MKYFSLNNRTHSSSFENAVIRGLAPDKGLYFPEHIEKLPDSFFAALPNMSQTEVAYHAIKQFVGDEIPEKDLKEIIATTLDFEFPVVHVKDNVYTLELFHGPTLAFKDIAMQIIGNMYEKILEKNNLKINIIVATSGDTGAAAIGAIKDRKNMKIFILHPHNKISEIQRKFMTTVDSSNVFNIALDGNFDECQNFVKLMFADKEFSKSIKMSGVNSINWSRIVAQIVYYFFAYFKTIKDGKKINFSVPTGNFGDIYAGYVAKKMGLPINKLVIATNNNDILKRAFNSGIYKPSKVKETISPSMDIQVASNFERLIFDICSCNSNETVKLMNDLKKHGKFKLKEENLRKIHESFLSESVSEEETKSVIKKIYKDEKILIDPHTAVGIGAINKISLEGDIIALGTADPSKFSDVIIKETSVMPELPNNLKEILNQKEKFEKLPKDLKKVKDYILSKI